MTELKTAKQHNAALTGESECRPHITPTPPVHHPINTDPHEGQMKPWTLRDLKDTRQNVRESVEAAAFVPRGAKAMLVEIIDEAFPTSKLLRLDAHAMIIEQRGKKVVNVAISIGDL